MRTIYISIIIMLQSIIAGAQNDSLQRQEFRVIASESIREDRSSDLQLIFSLGDSLSTPRAKLYLAQLDSIAIADTLDAEEPLSPYVEMEKHFWYEQSGKKKESLSALLHVQEMVDTLLTSDTQVYFFLQEYMVREFSEAGNYAAALKAETALYKSSLADMETLQRDHSEMLGAMEMEKRQREAENAKHIADLKDQNWFLLYGIFAGVAVVIILSIVLMVQTSRNRKRVAALSQKHHENPELELLTKKVTELKIESAQFKDTAQKLVDKLNEIDKANRLANTYLIAFSEELENSLTELNIQLNNSKNSLSPPGYMAFQNAITRMASSSADRLTAINEVLKA